MGAEILCSVRYQGQAGEGKAHLDTEEVLFRGPFRLRVPLRSLTRVEAADQERRVLQRDVDRQSPEVLSELSQQALEAGQIIRDAQAERRRYARSRGMHDVMLIGAIDPNRNVDRQGETS